MPGDPHKVFREGEQYMRDSLRTIWRELYDALYVPAEERPPPRCAIAHTEDGKPCGRESVARISLNGPPGCALAVELRAWRPGGYPLKHVDPREWKE